jgi:hypothetical protein
MEWALPAVILVFSIGFGLTKLIRMIGPRGRIIYLHLAVAMVASGIFLVIKGDPAGYRLMGMGAYSSVVSPPG